MNFRDDLARKIEGLTIDCMGDSFIIRGLKEDDLRALEGICSLQLIGHTAMIGWYDLINMLGELKRLGYSEATFENDGVANRIHSLQEYERLLGLLRKEDVHLTAEDINPKLFRIQRAGAAFLLSHRVGALFDEMGAGKTCQALFAYEMLRRQLGDAARCLVISPKTVKLEWRDAFKKFLGITATPIEDLEEGDNGATKQVLLVHYEQLISRKVGDAIKLSGVLSNIMAQNFSVIIADEAHFIKNRLAKRTRAVLGLMRNKPKQIIKFPVGNVGDQEISSAGGIPYIWFLTGTPMEQAGDIYTLLKSSFGEFTSVTNFLDAFTNYETRWYYRKKIRVAVGIKNEDKLASLVNKISLRRRRSEIVEIDSLDRIVTVDLDKKSRAAYNEIRYGSDNPLPRTIKAIQFCNHPGLVGYDQLTASPKYEALVEVIKSTDRKVVVWTTFREAVDRIVELLQGEGIKAVGLMGGDDVEEVKEEFLKPDTQVIVATVAKGGIGINFMKAASVVIYVEKPFSYTQYVQSRDRVMRIDRDLKEPVLFVNLKIENSTDDLLEKVMERKTTLYKLLLGGLENKNEIEEGGNDDGNRA